MSDDVKVEITRDAELEERMLAAVIADRNAQPRNQQVAVGPSSIGFCRELLRAQIFEGQDQNAAQEENWATAAHVGTVMGAELERIFGERIGALEQQRVTAFFPKLSVDISGAIDLLFVDGQFVSDLKSTTDIGGLLYDLNKNASLIETLLNIWRNDRLYAWDVETADGGYELTQAILRKFSKLHYYVQVATYVIGAIQMGALEPGATARLVFYDRAGEYQEFVALVITAEEIEMFFDIGQHRVEQAAQAQELLEKTGNPALIHHLRDQVPSFCYSPKVMCPLRERCWGGSDWAANNVLEGAELSSATDRYIEGRRLAALGDGMKKSAREELKGISGQFEDGRMVTWKGNTINVVETAKGKAAARKKDLSTENRLAPAEPAEEIPLQDERRHGEQGHGSYDCMKCHAEAEGLPPEAPTQEEDDAIVDATVAAAEAASLFPPERDPRVDRVQFRDSGTGEVVRDSDGLNRTERLREQQARVAADRARRAQGGR